MKRRALNSQPSTLNRRVEVMPARRVIEVAPDKKILPVPISDVSAIAVTRWQDCGDGTARPIYRIYEREIRVSEAEKILGIPRRTLLRLIIGGFVNGSQITPGYWQIDLVSWFDHVEAVRKDPEFWSREKNRRAYRDAL